MTYVSRLLTFLILPQCMATLVMLAPTRRAADVPQTVYFQSRDGKTELVGYLFLPESSAGGQRGERHPAVVMLHGRAGPYSSNANKECTFVGRQTRA